ncbi:MAG: AbrB/MazE/SpoVT family DNA-binding domain-containing protein [Candidatus Bathyarchaeia archaeon]
MIPEAKVRVSKKNTLYIPKAIAEAADIGEGSTLKMRVEDSKIVLEPLHDPFDLALKGSKFARTTLKEFEEESEELQDELFRQGED